MRASIRKGWRRWLPIAAAAVLLGTACSDRSRLSPPDAFAKSQPQKVTQPHRCDANRVANAVGQRPTPELLEAARAGAGASAVRTLAHDAPVSSNYRAEQLNLVLDTEGMIGSVNCG